MGIDRPSSRVSRRGEQTREQILSTAKHLFTQRGYHTTSLYDLFEGAGITKGAFFHHWKSKEDLALAVLDEIGRMFEEYIFAVARDKGRAREKMERLLRGIDDITSNGKWPYMRIFALWSIELGSDDEKLGPAVQLLSARWQALWRELIQKAQQEADLRADISAENLSFLVSSAILGVQLMNVKPKVAADSTKIALETLRRTLLT